MTDAFRAALGAPVLYPALFVSVTFSTSTLNVWTGIGTLSWDGITDWHGIGTLLGISTIEDGSGVEARGTAIELSGLDADLLADCENDYQLGLPFTIYLGLFDSPPEQGGNLIPLPIVVWTGATDRPILKPSAETFSITISGETRLLDLNVAADRRYTQQDQQALWPGDLGMMFVSSLQERTDWWGFPMSSTNV